MTSPVDPLRERYAPRPRWQRLVLLGVVALVAVVFLVWVAWAAWFHATPLVQSHVVTYDVRDDHEVHATVDVQLEDGVRAHCVVQATAIDHSVVGELTFVPHDGRNEVSVRTEREATSVSIEGCTAPGQSRPR